MAAAASPAPVRLLLDEMLDPEIAVQLRGRGCDVESVQADHPELEGSSDAVVLEEAAKLSRTLVTDNVRHFLPLHDAFLSQHKRYAGLLLAHPRAYPRSKKTIGLWVRAIEEAVQRIGARSMENTCEWL